MRYYRLGDEKTHSLLEISEFDNGSEVKEYHLMLHQTNPELTFTEQLSGLFQSYQTFINGQLQGAKAVFKRYFVSDAANQEKIILDENSRFDEQCVTSVIEQTPLNRTKVAMWAYLQTNVAIHALVEGLSEIRHNSYSHLWGTAISVDSDVIDSEYQTLRLFKNYITQLSRYGYNLSDNCIRTWLFVDNIDKNYGGVVQARNEIFDKEGLTKDTHFIASTGIYGKKADPTFTVQMDTFAVKGLSAGQVQYLHAPSHLNPTHEYGVSFERGTSVKYGDRRQVFISGTASIDNKGEIVWAGDIRKQTYRMWENVEMLLKEADCTFEDLAHLIVYLRDPSDYIIIHKLFEEKFPEIPTIIVHAPVCRPGWLIEMECIAIKAEINEEYPTY